jgi:nucleoside-diphosphate-sugar epimerase
MTRLLIFGAGYAARRAARRNRSIFSRIAGTTRKIEKADALAAAGIEPLLFEDEHRLREALSEADHLLVSVAPDETGDPVLSRFADALRGCGSISWICYLSTVGVYGDHHGAWVDEQSECRPTLPRSQWRLKSERAWQDLAASMQVPLAILRLSGIYGPGRNAFVNIEKGTSRRIVKPGQVFNRVHRDDIAKAFGLASGSQLSGIFNISDDLPAPPHDVVAFAHSLHGSNAPAEVEFADANMTDMARSFYCECKRVANLRSKTALGMAYDWPDYRSALARMWQDGSWRSD